MSEQIIRAKLFNWFKLLPGRIRPDLGTAGENLGKRYLKRSGYSIIASNWRCARGELDIIACKESTLVIAEVKSRSEPAARFFNPLEAIDGSKRSHILRAAEQYLRQKSRMLKKRRINDVRFDLLAITVQGLFAVIEHCKGIPGFEQHIQPGN